MAAAGLTAWDSADSIPTTAPFGMSLQWGTHEDPHFCIAPLTVITMARMEALLLAPERVEPAEFFAYLPEVGSSPVLKDNFMQSYGFGETFPVLFAKAASTFGEKNIS